ncbi:MAG: HEAT repeat domain-containing protein [Chitinispirillaceae bacterium]
MNRDEALKAIEHPSAKYIAAGLHSLAEVGTLADLQKVMSFLKHQSSVVCNEAVLTTANIIKENLISRFHDLQPQVRQKLGALMEQVHPTVINEIAKDIYGEDEQRRLRSVQVLGLLRKNPTVRDILARLIQYRDQKVRATAINLLGKLIGPHDHQILLSLLNDPDKRVRANTVEALESLGNRRLVPVLLRFRKDPNNRIRGNVIKALHTLGYTDIIPDLMEMLESDSNFMKASALWVISQICTGTEEIIDLAARNLLSDNLMVRQNAHNALSALDTPRAHGFLHYLSLREDEFTS